MRENGLIKQKIATMGDSTAAEKYEKVVKGKGKVVLVLFLTDHSAMKEYCGSESITSLILDLGTRWR
jgi:hypothetical protein